MTKIAQVLIPPLESSYSYEIPLELIDSVHIGTQVQVKLGNREAEGFVVETREDPRSPDQFEFKLKPILSDPPPKQAFLEEQLPFLSWIANYYGSPLASVLDVAIPHAVAPKQSWIIEPDQEIEMNKLRGNTLELAKFIRDNPNDLNYDIISRRFKGALATLRKLEQRGFIKLSKQDITERFYIDEDAPTWAKRDVTLNKDQIEAVYALTESVKSRSFERYLLHGVTGSGKTEVYIEAIKEALNAGRSALVIVPEIALTPQLLDRFRARLGNELAVLHSALPPRMRWNAWQALLTGRARVAIGARSGIFAPLKDIGIIIVDEEHDSSYKQNDGLRYHARDLALVLAKTHKCPVVLGSATPSIESFISSKGQKYKLLSLPGRHSQSKPEIQIVDLNRLKPWEMASSHISPTLFTAIDECVKGGGQTFVLYNRRGFASYLQCEKCSSVIECENCSVTMTYHRGENSLLCHYCGFSIPPPTLCPNCNNNDEKKEPGKLQERGAGTERIFEELKELFPDTSIERLDRDSASDHATYQDVLDRLRKKEIQVLVGTQLIAKGHDLPDVTLVGIADCDVGLHLPDFRSSERIFQLLTQAAGRAGRGERTGRVVLQTRLPQHPSIIKTLEQDYEGFIDLETIARKQLRFPPFSNLLRIVVSSQEKELPRNILISAYDGLSKIKKESDLNFDILGPAPAPIKKVKTLWRWHLLLRSPERTPIHRLLNAVQKLNLYNNRARVTFDVDPYDML